MKTSLPLLILIESQEEKSRTPEDEGQRGRLEVIPREKEGARDKYVVWY